MFLAPLIPSAAAGLKDMPSRLKIANWGRNEGVNGSFTVGPKTAKFLPMLQKALGFDTVALDFEHNTVPGTPAYKADKEPRNVAAHAPISVISGEGLFLTGLKWTPEGTKSISEGLHPDLSPAVKTDDAGEVIFIHSAALCRQGSVADLKVFSAADVFSAEQLACFSALTTPVKSTSTMDYKKLLCLMLGVAETATDTEIEAGAKAFAAKAPAVETFNTSLATLQKRLDQIERDGLVAQAIAAGKIVPHSVTGLTNEQFAALLKDLPGDQVPVGQRTAEGVKVFSAALTTADASGDAAVRKLLRIPEATWNKHNPA
jgi:phage I-like protein